MDAKARKRLFGKAERSWRDPDLNFYVLTWQTAEGADPLLPFQSDHFNLLVALGIVGGGTQSLQPLIRISVFSFDLYRGDQFQNLLICRSASKSSLQIVAHLGKETSHQLSIGCEARTCTTGAKRLSNRGNNPDLSLAIEEFIVH